MTIPASDIVSGIPSVLGAGGSNALLTGLYLTQNPLMPAGEVLSFSSPAAVAAFFGLASTEAAQATIYFPGFENATQSPANVLFAPFNLTARSAWLQGGATGITLQALANVSGSLTIVFDGYTRTAAAINLATYATSYSTAATEIQTLINASLPAEATATLCTIAGTTLTVGGVITGSFAAGQTVVGASVTNSPVITAQLTGTTPGGAGTYSLSTTSAPVSVAESMTADATAVAVTWSSTLSAFVITSGITGAASTATYATGTIAAALGLTSATGASLSQGAVADTPASAMNNVIAAAQNWCGFTTLWEPVLADKINFAIWSNSQQYWPYVYAGWDSDPQAIYQNSTECFGYLITQAEYNGVIAISGDPNVAFNAGTTLGAMALNVASFVLGSIASVDFSQKNGRITFMFKSQAGMLPTVTNLQIKNNLVANGYSFYGSWASKGNGWKFFANGAMPGEFEWLDDFIDQVWMLDQFQVADMNLLTRVSAIPYNETGYSLLRADKMDVIQAALNFGAIRAGVVLSSAQIAEINNAAGASIASVIQSQGYYLQILDPGPSARTLRQTPIQNFWYTNGGAIQRLVLNSIDVM